MASRIRKAQTLKQDRDERTVEAIRQQRLSELRLRTLTPAQVEAAREAINRNRSVYEALRDS